MQRIPPSEQIRKQLDDLLNNGLVRQENPIGTMVQLGTQLVVQELLERETTELLGRAHNQHRKPDEPLRGHRNRHEPGRLHTVEGDIPVQAPQVRNWVGEGPYRSSLTALGELGIELGADLCYDRSGSQTSQRRSPRVAKGMRPVQIHGRPPG